MIPGFFLLATILARRKGWAVWPIYLFFAAGLATVADSPVDWFCAGFAACMAFDELFDVFFPKIGGWWRRVTGSRA